MNETKDRIANLLKNYHPGIRGHTSETRQDFLKPCTVIVPLIGQESSNREVSVLLIRRSSSLRRNPGEYAFPGGMFEEQDRNDPYACALREWQEEMGSTNPDSILGQLDTFCTLSGLIIKPVVYWFDYSPAIEMSKHEVQEIFYVPLAFFQEKNCYREIVRRQHTQFECNAYYWQQKRIWGATAGIIANLIEVLKPVIQ